MVGCVSSSLQATPQSIDETPSVTQPQAPHASPDGVSTDLPDDDVPLSPAGEPSVVPSRTASSSPAARSVCRHPASEGRRACDALVEGGTVAPALRNGCRKLVPYCASDVQSAYGVAQAARNGGRGAMVAIVGAYGYPDAAKDLAVYRKSMGLPSCTAGGGCLKVLNESARSAPLPRSNGDPADDWRAEEALDLDAVSAICPNCRIALVQANSDKSVDLGAAVNAAAGIGALAIVTPYSGKEESAADASYRHAGVAIAASAGNGDDGKAPCSYAGVVCVGGTSLAAASTARGWSERAWGRSASGCSALVAKPGWQRAASCKTRSVPDLSALADPQTGIAVYDSSAGGWLQMGGTSAGAAIVAALFALGPGTARVNAPRWIWQHGSSSAYHHLGNSRSGYDGATGWGSPNGIAGL